MVVLKMMVMLTLRKVMTGGVFSNTQTSQMLYHVNHKHAFLQVELSHKRQRATLDGVSSLSFGVFKQSQDTNLIGNVQLKHVNQYPTFLCCSLLVPDPFPKWSGQMNDSRTEKSSSLYPSVYLSVCLSAHPSVHPSIRPSNPISVSTSSLRGQQI